MNRREQELRDVLEEHGGLIRRIIASYERDLSLQSDLQQEVALALWEALPRFRGEGSKRAFVARVAQNRSIAHAVRRSREPPTDRVEVQDPGLSVDDQVDADRRRHELLSAVRALPVHDKQLVVLSLEGFTTREIASELGITENNAGVRLHRARAALKKRMRKWTPQKTGTS